MYSNKVSKNWLFYEIVGFICHRSDYRYISKKEELLNCLNNDEEFQLYENNYEAYTNGNGNGNSNGSVKNRLTIEEFLWKYFDITVLRFDDNRDSNTSPFEERRQFLSKLADFDDVDKKYAEEEMGSR